MEGESIEERAVSLARQTSDLDQAVTELVEMAGGQRGPLEDARRRLVLRLHRRSSDYDATNALRVVSRALERIGRDPAGYPQLGAAPAQRHRARRQPLRQAVRDAIRSRRRGHRIRAGWRPSPAR